MAAQNEIARAGGAGGFELMIGAGLLLMGSIPGQPGNVGAADADIGKFTVAEARKLAQAAVIALPFLDEADKGGKHGVSLSLTSRHWPVNRITRKIVIPRILKSNNAALQLG
jgi:hypothetical protein